MFTITLTNNSITQIQTNNYRGKKKKPLIDMVVYKEFRIPN